MKFFLSIMFILTLVGCEEHGDTEAVRALATKLCAGGNGVDTTFIWYEDLTGNVMDSPGLRLSRRDENTWRFYDEDGELWDGYCPNIELCGGNITGAGGILTVKGRYKGDSHDGHSPYCEHSATGQWCAPVWSPRNNKWMVTPTYYRFSPGCPTEMMLPYDGNPNFKVLKITLPTAKGNLTSEAQTAMSAPTSGGASSAMAMAPIVIDPNAIVLPPNGYNYDVHLVRQLNQEGINSAERTNKVYISDANDWTDNFRYQFPCKYEYIIATATPQDAMGLIGSALLKSDLIPDGIPVEVEIVAVNQSGTVCAAITDYFLPMTQECYDSLMLDPNEPVIFDRWSPISPEEQHLYDPNMYSDPNDFPDLTIDTMEEDFMDRHDPNRIVPMHYLPCSDDDTIRISMSGGVGVVIGLGNNWLTSDETADLNQDGIVNFGDIGFFTN